MARRERALTLQAMGLKQSQIAKAMGVSASSVSGYLKAPGRLQPVNAATVDRLVTNAAGLTDAANQIGGVIAPTQGQVDRWVDDLTLSIQALSRLRTRLKEGQK